MEAILDMSQDLDVGLLDRVALAMLTGSGPEQQMAQRVLTQFGDNPDAWQRVPVILEHAQNTQSKYIALQILDKLIATRWKMLPAGQRGGIRNFVIDLVVKCSQDEATLRREKAFLGKLNLTLVQILKQEWPHNWPTFIPELVASSKESNSLAENNMVILKLLSEEVFDYSAEQMVQAKAKNLKHRMCGEFSEIFQLCSEILATSTVPTLIKATLDTLLRFLNWIPLGYIFETTIIDNLVARFLNVPDYRNVTLKCLSEIANLSISPAYDQKFVIMFQMVMSSINEMMPPSTPFKAAYENGTDAEQEFVLNLALFLTNFLGRHLKLIENSEYQPLVVNAHLYLVKISTVDEREVFKICLEYWSILVAGLYEENQQLPIAEINPLLGLNLGGAAGYRASGMEGRKKVYHDVLSNLRLVMIEKMVKPEEVLIVENDEGEIVREFMKESDTIVLYKSMRDVLVYLTHLDTFDTESIMTDKLSRQVDGSEWSWQNLNTLCWAIGSISGSMNEETEKRFLVTVIKDLLGLCEAKRGKDNKAVVASNIMYIVGQYPRFLKAHWKFLKTVVNKLFEFMHETHEGVQDMACDTFIKIAHKCRRHFVMQQHGEAEPFIDEILRTLHRITVDLSPLQVHTFYEAVGHMISAQPNKPTQERLIQKLMEMPNSAWDDLMHQAQQNVDVLSNPENIKILSNVLKTNVSACTSIGPFFLPQIGRIYMDMLALYNTVSGIISETVVQQGLIATKTPKVRSLRTIKKEALKLVETYVKRAEDLQAIKDTFIGQLFEAILGDYRRNVPAARDAEVLNVVAAIVTKLGSLLTDQVPLILEGVFEPTLNMINQDFAEFPEHRVGFWKLLGEINLNCFPALLSLPPPQFKLTIDSIIWAIKHTMRDIAETGLSICHEFIKNIERSPEEVANQFYQQYLLNIVQDVFFVLTDTDHKSGFKMQSILLAQIFKLIESGQVKAPLWDPTVINDPNMTNQLFIRQYTANLLKTAFGHVPQAQIEAFVIGMCETNTDLNRFKTHLRDFLISLKEFGGDNTELYVEEKEAEQAAKLKAEREKAEAVPGLLKPDQIKDEDEEL